MRSNLFLKGLNIFQVQALVLEVMLLLDSKLDSLLGISSAMKPMEFFKHKMKSIMLKLISKVQKLEIYAL